MTTASPPPAARTANYVPGLDGVRALAIGLVLFAHSVIHDQFTTLRPVGIVAGYAGVAVFFVLSGYLITTLLLREEERWGDISLRLFYLRRAYRLFPALWVYLAVVAVLRLAGWLPHHPWHSFASALLYTRNLVGRGHETDHLWSLSIEEQFYLLWPLLLLALPRRNVTRFVVAVGSLVGVTGWRVYAARHDLASVGALYMRSDFRFNAPLFGCVLALVSRVWPHSIRHAHATGFRSATLAVAGVGGLLAWVGFRVDDRVPHGFEFIAIYILSMILILSQTGVSGVGSRWLAWRPLVVIGQLSYSLYLWQQLFLGDRIAGFVEIRTFPIGLLATFAVATASYLCVERPLVRLKNRYFHRSPKRP